MAISSETNVGTTLVRKKPLLFYNIDIKGRSVVSTTEMEVLLYWETKKGLMTTVWLKIFFFEFHSKYNKQLENIFSLNDKLIAHSCFKDGFT